MLGKVYIIGAGPGDEGLITAKGLKIIKQADVILYDRLANPKLLNQAQEEAQLFYVGKKAGEHYRTQTEINQLLIEQAQAGKLVARLKGGDPFIFGRGGEEATTLVEAGIEFEIIPGITSPIAVPAYAGIPLTHRDFNSSVAFVTGHESPTKDQSQVNWSQLATGVGSLVILMGVRKLPQIVPQLIDAGRDRQTPVALVRWGTRAKQETLVGTLENIVSKVEEANFKPPAIIIVGEVVKLRKKLNWFEKKELFGKSIVVTRPQKQAQDFCQSLATAGAKVIEAPAIEIKPPVDYQELDNKLEQLKSYDWVIFTSVNGVKYVIERLFSLGEDVRALAGVKLCAIGSKTAAKLKSYGLRVDYIPEDYVSESILAGFSEQDLTSKKFLLPRANLARAALKEGLLDLGAEVDNITAYQTVEGSGNNQVIKRLKEGEIDLITFTSSSTVRNFMNGLGSNYKKLLRGVDIACIGPITAGTARKYGLTVEIIANEYTIAGLTEAIKKYYRRD
ncbi:uroporphyrin-III C-methyltransferase [Halobacteroides halobius DSM 5150]|uniref:uroporphyrinogen-III C-methyltransferase n=1 Tax=Halobacteroides halobius (strain ATCC 35273 / DSM 5150 / MD-1) TaxID=748449 RepID=L0KAT5_HALHC|nr:uroporphyrinogen-III C-methyltransferase [Halobacteroides halobius]AGB41203.1 uroporphyrin-III C-methyltransferase [Halobacteroides halobius DSM 5150]